MFCLKPWQSPLAPRCFLYWYTKLLSYQAYFVTHLQTILPPLVKQESLVPSRSTNKKHNNSCTCTYLCNWRLHPFWNTMDHLFSRVLYWRAGDWTHVMMPWWCLQACTRCLCPSAPSRPIVRSLSLSLSSVSVASLWATVITLINSTNKQTVYLHNL